MRLLVQFEYLESAAISILELRGARIFICGHEENWVKVYKELEINIPYGNLEGLDQKVKESIRDLLAEYPVTRNLQVWVPFPVDVVDVQFRLQTNILD